MQNLRIREQKDLDSSLMGLFQYPDRNPHLKIRMDPLVDQCSHGPRREY